MKFFFISLTHCNPSRNIWKVKYKYINYNWNKEEIIFMRKYLKSKLTEGKASNWNKLRAGKERVLSLIMNREFIFFFFLNEPILFQMRCEQTYLLKDMTLYTVHCTVYTVQKNWLLAKNLNYLISLSLQPDDVNLVLQLIPVWNIKSPRHQVAKI